jgi:hypothetical protein
MRKVRWINAQARFGEADCSRVLCSFLSATSPKKMSLRKHYSPSFQVVRYSPPWQGGTTRLDSSGVTRVR